MAHSFVFRFPYSSPCESQHRPESAGACAHLTIVYVAPTHVKRNAKPIPDSDHIQYICVGMTFPRVGMMRQIEWFVRCIRDLQFYIERDLL
jgi:hypothetical protein